MGYFANAGHVLARDSRGGRAMSGMGATETSTDFVAALVAQVNRFGPSAPAAYRYSPVTYPLATGKVPENVALSATFILHRRAQDAVLKFNDAASITMMQRAAAGMKSPVSYITSNIYEATNIIKTYADSVGLPAAGALTVNKILGVPATTVAVGVCGALALGYLFFGRKS